MSLISNPARVYHITCHEALRFEQVASLRAEVASNLFTVFHADTSHGRRLLQVLHGQFLCFALIFPRSPQNSCRFDPIYYLPHRILNSFCFPKIKADVVAAQIQRLELPAADAPAHFIPANAITLAARHR